MILAKALPYSQLECLSLRKCGITAVGAKALATAIGLQEHPPVALKTVLLDDNGFGLEGAKAIGAMLSSARVLQRLSLERTLLNDEGVSTQCAWRWRKGS